MHLEVAGGLTPPPAAWLSRAVWALLGAAILAGLAGRIFAVASQCRMTHDEATTYLIATSHVGDYSYSRRQNPPPWGTWARAEQWKRMLRPEKAGCFGQIRADLVRTDVHPPLYFWLMHVWILIFGSGLRTGIALNVVLDVLTAGAMYKLGRHCLGSRLQAMAVVALWLLSPAAGEASLEARQYSLLALWGTLLVWQVSLVADPRRAVPRWQYAAIALVTGAGMLTQSTFLLLPAGAGVLLGLRLARRHRRRLLGGITALAAGAAIFVCLYPQFYRNWQVLRRRAGEEPFGPEQFALRIEKVATTLTSFFTERGGAVDFAADYAGAVLIALAAVPAVLAGVWLVAARARRLRRLDVLRAAGGKRLAVIFWLLWIGGASVYLYLSFKVPLHAMAPKYLSLAWPLLAVVVVMACGLARTRVAIPVVLLCVGMLASAGDRAVGLHQLHQRHALLPKVLAGAKAIVMDNPRRGVLLPVMYHVPDETMVFVASQEHMIDAPRAWQKSLGDGSLYLTNPRYETTEEGTEMMLALIGQLNRRVLFVGELPIIRMWSPVLAFAVGPPLRPPSQPASEPSGP